MDSRSVHGRKGCNRIIPERGYGLHSWSPESGDAMTCNNECTCEREIDSNVVDSIIANVGNLDDDDLKRLYDAVDWELQIREDCPW